MMKLSVQDEFDGNGKIDELRNAIGDECLGTILLSVSNDWNRCEISRMVIGGKVKVLNEPSWLTWNRMFS